MQPNILLAFNAVLREQRRGLYADCTTFGTVRAIYRALMEGGNTVFPVNFRNEAQVTAYLRQIPPIDLALVIAEGFLDEPQSFFDGGGAARIRRYLAQQGIPCTHTGAMGMEICRRKELTYRVLRQTGICVPAFDVIKPSIPLDHQLNSIQTPYPLFVKPVGGGDSMGIDEHSVVFDREQLITKVESIYQELGPTPLLVETFLSGREYTIGIIGNKYRIVFPALAFPRDLMVRTLHVKQQENQLRDRFEVIGCDHSRYLVLADIASRTFDVVGASDVIRLDLREDQDGQLHVIDVNGTPSLGTRASFSYMAVCLGITHGELINLVLYESMLRHGLIPPKKMEEIVVGPLAKLAMYRQEVA